MSVVSCSVRVTAGEKRHGMRIDQQVLIKNPRFASSATGSKPRPLVRPPADGLANGKIEDESPASSVAPAPEVFSAHDVVTNTLAFVADAEAPEQLLQVSTISRSFRSAALSDLIWKELCARKWQCKFGYKSRMKQAELDSEKDDANDDPRVIHPSIRQYPTTPAKDSFWYRRYWRELKGSSIKTISLSDLQSVSWSCCRWFKRPHRRNPTLLRSGLNKPASNHVRFCNDGFVRGGDGDEPDAYHLLDGGAVVNMTETAEEYCPGRTLQVHRTKNWGWELRSQYLVLRSIDEGGPAGIWDDYICTLCTESKQPGDVSTRYGDNDKIVARVLPALMEGKLPW